jgi:hypothetical protein
MSMLASKKYVLKYSRHTLVFLTRDAFDLSTVAAEAQRVQYVNI